MFFFNYRIRLINRTHSVPASFHKSINTFNFNVLFMDSLYKFTFLPLLFHETIPGHSLQLTTYHSEQLVYKVTIGWRLFPFNTPLFLAAIEGWGLYAEYLAKELNCYKTNSDLLGYYSLLLIRAARLVVDTGIHGYGWTNDRAMNYILQNTIFNRKEAESEVNRYYYMPGQATSYYVGYLAIRKALNKAEKKLGQLFNLSHFHEVILESLKFGALEIMEKDVDELIEFTLKCSKGDEYHLFKKFHNINCMNITKIQTSKSPSLNQLSLIFLMAYQTFLFIVFTL